MRNGVADMHDPYVNLEFLFLFGEGLVECSDQFAEGRVSRQIRQFHGLIADFRKLHDLVASFCQEVSKDGLKRLQIGDDCAHPLSMFFDLHGNPARFGLFIYDVSGRVRGRRTGLSRAPDPETRDFGAAGSDPPRSSLRDEKGGAKQSRLKTWRYRRVP